MKYFRAKMDGEMKLKTFLSNGRHVILVIMDVVQLTVTVFATAAVNICVIVWLYSKWIIPEIVRRVRDDMMTSIQTWIENTRDDLNNSITINIDSMKDKIVQTIRGYRGNKARQLSLAKEFLEGSDYDPDNPETEENESIITDAIARYGASIVKAALKSMTTKQATAEEPAGVW